MTNAEYVAQNCFRVGLGMVFAAGWGSLLRWFGHDEIGWKWFAIFMFVLEGLEIIKSIYRRWKWRRGNRP